jgi:hypothetical protein
MASSTKNLIIADIAGTIDIPDSANEKAEARYRDLGEWFERKEARCRLFSPHIYPQGSFRLGTVVRPVAEEDEYDLDMGCRLRVGISKTSHTQKQLKDLVGADLEDYRLARGIKAEREEKPRCWRLKYADTIKFHLDTVPSIPETPERRQLIREYIARGGIPDDLARVVGDMTGAITDDRLWNYRIIDGGWRLSNSEGFARWFELRMKLAKVLMEKVALDAKIAKIDDLPAYRWKSPLQRCVQLLKRHRDVMFAQDPSGKPPSIIITTLAARAYQGETNIADALDMILSAMADKVSSTGPRVPNPVNPLEDFADRWSDPGAGHLKLEEKFWRWLHQARLDFNSIGTSPRPDLIVAAANDKLAARLDENDLGTRLRLRATKSLLKPAVVPIGLSFPDKPIVPKNPGQFA